ncbi:porin [Roseibacillus persicicus]|nr:porin [Roseibacillus persicicus]
MKDLSRTTIAALITTSMPLSALTMEELAARLEKLENKVEAYETKYGPLESPSARPAAKSTPAKAPSSDDDIDALYDNRGFEDSTVDSSALAWAANTQIGGYGELHFNRDLGGGGDNTVDFHRWVLFLNHSFSDRIKLYSEFELEHSLAGDGAPGEVELEQAYIDFTLDHGLNAKAGLFLLPLGLLNETHEPDTFFGVERNRVESNIIPTTWWEAGVGATQTLDNGLGWDLAIHSGLNLPTSGSNAFRIRSGRQKVAEAAAEDPAVTARVRYNGVPGLSLSAFAQYQNDVTQTTSDEDNSAFLVGGTAVYQAGGFGLKALIASWNIDGQSFEDNGADHQWGGYLEPSYTWTIGTDQRLGVFARYSHYEYARGIGNVGGGTFDQYDVGVNYWPIDNVVLKADYSHIVDEDDEVESLLNLGVGYSF